MLNSEESSLIILHNNTEAISQIVNWIFEMESIRDNYFLKDKIILHKNIRCIVIKDEDDPSDIFLYTFDKTNRIRLIIPKEKIVDKLLSSDLVFEEGEIHKYLIELTDPFIDLKVARNEEMDEYYVSIVLSCGDFKKLDKQDKNFGSPLAQINHKEFNYVQVQSDLLLRLDVLNQSFEYLENKSFFNLDNHLNFFSIYDFLFFSKKPIERNTTEIAVIDHGLPEDLNISTGYNITEATVTKEEENDYDEIEREIEQGYASIIEPEYYDNRNCTSTKTGDGEDANLIKIEDFEMNRLNIHDQEDYVNLDQNLNQSIHQIKENNLTREDNFQNSIHYKPVSTQIISTNQGQVTTTRIILKNKFNKIKDECDSDVSLTFENFELDVQDKIDEESFHSIFHLLKSNNVI